MGMKSAAAAAVAVGTALAVCILQLTRRPTWKEFSCATMQNSKSCSSSSPYFSLARSSPEIAPPRSESEERGNMPAAAALTPLARSFLPRVLSLVSLPRTHSH